MSKDLQPAAFGDQIYVTRV